MKIAVVRVAARAAGYWGRGGQPNGREPCRALARQGAVGYDPSSFLLLSLLVVDVVMRRRLRHDPRVRAIVAILMGLMQCRRHVRITSACNACVSCPSHVYACMQPAVG